MGSAAATANHSILALPPNRPWPKRTQPISCQIKHVNIQQFYQQKTSDPTSQAQLRTQKLCFNAALRQGLQLGSAGQEVGSPATLSGH
jgi:hypothetical protein